MKDAASVASLLAASTAVCVSAAASEPPGIGIQRDGDGVVLAGWSGDCLGTGDCVVTLDRARAVTATFAPTAGLSPFVNGDFEQGPTVGWEQQPGTAIFPASNLGGAEPYSGRYAALLGFDQDGRRQAQLGQRITLYLNGQVVVQDDRVCQGSGTDGWLRYSVDVSALAGQSVAVVFEIYSTDGLWSALLLDDVAIAGQAWGEQADQPSLKGSRL